MSKNTSKKECYCHTCKTWYHYLGIARHRAMHRDKKENCVITFTNGNMFGYDYADKE